MSVKLVTIVIVAMNSQTISRCSERILPIGNVGSILSGSRYLHDFKMFLLATLKWVLSLIVVILATIFVCYHIHITILYLSIESMTLSCYNCDT